MLLQEFIDRTNYYPTAEEWEAANRTYTHDSELNKDEFCKLWVKMNHNKVDKQRKELERKRKAWETYEKSYGNFLYYSRMERVARKDSTRDEYRRKANESWETYVKAREELMDIGVLDRCNSLNYRDY